MRARPAFALAGSHDIKASQRIDQAIKDIAIARDVSDYNNEKMKQEKKIVMNKLVNGAEEQMITLHFAYDRERKTLSTIYRLTSFWEFTSDGDMMYGTLIFDRELYRIIKLKKEK